MWRRKRIIEFLIPTKKKQDVRWEDVRGGRREGLLFPPFSLQYSLSSVVLLFVVLVRICVTKLVLVVQLE